MSLPIVDTLDTYIDLNKPDLLNMNEQILLKNDTYASCKYYTFDDVTVSFKCLNCISFIHYNDRSLSSNISDNNALRSTGFSTYLLTLESLF